MQLFSRSVSIDMKWIYLAIGIFLFMTSCYQEVVVPDINREVFEFSMSPDMQEYVYNSRDTSYTIEDPDLSLLFNDRQLDIKEIRIRGQTTLDYKRKSYSVFLDNPFVISGREDNEHKILSRFKLISLSMDYTYINNRIAFGILEQAGIMPLLYKYVEVIINGDTQGVYLLVEDPEQFVVEQGSEFILRRGYHHGTSDAEYKPSYYNRPREEYETRFREVYTQLPYFEGEDLYDALGQRIDLNQYFRKMGIDFLLQNGDYTDEIFFYSSIEDNEIHFSIIPWDYDDIFSTYPHEVGRSWGIGKIFGIRSYNTRQDIYDEIGDKMIFSIEDDLDYAIAMDSLMYVRYVSTLSNLLKNMNPETIKVLFDQVEDELTPFYSESDIILQSQFDNNSTSLELWRNNMHEKRVFLEQRLEYMQNQLDILRP